MLDWFRFQREMYSFERFDRKIRVGFAIDLAKARSEKKSNDVLRKIADEKYYQLKINDEER